MTILIDGTPAVLSQSQTIEYISENRAFSGADGYTLSITLPADNPTNRRIFSNISRLDARTPRKTFPARIIDAGFVRAGIVVITAITRDSISLQFLEGRSATNFSDSFETIYINDLDLGRVPSRSPLEIDTQSAWTDGIRDLSVVALPWVNDATGNIQNSARWNPASAQYEWVPGLQGLSWQPYLVYIAELIFRAAGYTPLLYPWRNNPALNRILVCNALPFAWDLPDWNAILPHWTLAEFISQLEDFLDLDFSVDHQAKTVSCRAKTPAGTFLVSDILSSYQTDINNSDSSSSCQYAATKRLAYDFPDSPVYDRYSCPWLIDLLKTKVNSYPTFDDLMAARGHSYTWDGLHNTGYDPQDELLYAADIDAYFAFRSLGRNLDLHSLAQHKTVFLYETALRPVNLLGPRIPADDDDSSAQETTLSIVPVRIDSTAEVTPISYNDPLGDLPFLSFGSYDDAGQYDAGEYDESQNYPMQKTRVQSLLENGQRKERPEFYDRIFVAWWDGRFFKERGQSTQLPRPYVEQYVIYKDADLVTRSAQLPFSFRLATRRGDHSYDRLDIDPTTKLTVSFLCDSIPDVRRIFIIAGRRYICEKITATFTVRGRSPILKGIFWPIRDNT